MYRIRQREQIVPNFHIMEFGVPWSVNKIKPGQFVIVMSDEKAERIPFTISDWDAEKNSVTIIFMETGWSTKRLAKLNAADELSHVAGPLGMPSKIEKHGHVVLAGGCYGIGGIYPIARAMKEAGNKVTCMIEGRDEIMLYWRDKLRNVCDELLLATSDGSFEIDGQQSFHGHGWGILQKLSEDGRKVDLVHAVGCTFMMYMFAQITRKLEIPCVVALNPIMLDGTGMCGCCRVSVAGKTKFACVDGPEFDAHQIDWQELFHRKSVYADEEVDSYKSTPSI